MSIRAFTDSESLTPFLYQLIEGSAGPLRAVETTFAPDSTGCSTSRFVKGFDEKYGPERSGREWVKAQVRTGVRTNIITTVIVEGPAANDGPLFRPLLEQTVAGGFAVKEVPADKAYLSKADLELAAKPGAGAFIPFKSNSVPGEPGSRWERLFGYGQFNRAALLAH